MKTIITVVVVFSMLSSWAQVFEKKVKMIAPTTLSNSKIQWIDADNDSLLDVLAINTVQNEVKLMFFKNQGHDSFATAPTVSTGYQSAITFLTDFDNDNKIDIILSGKNSAGASITEIFLNKGNFNFAKSSSPIKNQAFTTIGFTDLNNDGAKDLIAGDNNRLYLFEQRLG
jgi:hypothetical protein